jgi:ABC-type branched-subunit amino acid transport system ATPase component
MLKVEGIVSGYNNVKIIRGVNMHVAKGEIVSLIGRNGVGKSTFMKTVMGAIRPMQGSIYYLNEDITKKPVHTRAGAGIGYVEQGHGIFPNLTVEENMLMGLNIHNRKKSGILDVGYEYFPKMKERHHQKAGTLSGGEQAMLSIARVLVGEPDIILLDEPSEGVQPNIVDQLGDILLELNERLGITVLLVEQHLKLIQQISQRCLAMDKGQIVGELTREQLSDNTTITSYLTV